MREVFVLYYVRKKKFLYFSKVVSIFSESKFEFGHLKLEKCSVLIVKVQQKFWRVI